jgi:hypothetical protein
MSHTAFGRRPLFRTGIMIVGFCGLLLPFWVVSGRDHSRDQFAYDHKPLKADVISLRRLVLPRMLPVLSNRGVRPCLTINHCC